MSVFVCLTLPVLSRTICGLRYIIITGLSLKENIVHKKTLDKKTLMNVPLKVNFLEGYWYSSQCMELFWILLSHFIHNRIHI